jgi:hypothetical protein
METLQYNNTSMISIQLRIKQVVACTPGTISALEGSLMVENGLQSSSTSAKVKNIQFQVFQLH